MKIIGIRSDLTEVSVKFKYCGGICASVSEIIVRCAFSAEISVYRQLRSGFQTNVSCGFSKAAVLVPRLHSEIANGNNLTIIVYYNASAVNINASCNNNQ